MRRTILILITPALMVMLMAATTSPAFAYHKGWAHEGWGPQVGYGSSDCDGDGIKDVEDDSDGDGLTDFWDNCQQPTVI